MERIVMECGEVRTKEDFHSARAKALDFPAWYGGNLDALHDCLMELAEPVRLILRGTDALGIFAGGFCRVLEDAREENPNLDFRME